MFPIDGQYTLKMKSYYDYLVPNVVSINHLFVFLFVNVLLIAVTNHQNRHG